MPRRVIAPREPAPIGHQRQQHPNRATHASRQVGYRGVDRDYQVEVGGQRGGFLEVVQRIEQGSEIQRRESLRFHLQIEVSDSG